MHSTLEIQQKLIGKFIEFKEKMMKLIKPNISYSKEIMDFRDEVLEDTDKYRFSGLSCLEKFDSSEEWIEYLKSCENIQTCPKGTVNSDEYIFVREDDNKIVGMINLRRQLNDFLRTFGGQIGYCVRPSERGKGYGKKMLSECLDICRKNLMDKVLLTCDSTNEISKKTILSNGGVYEGSKFQEEENKTVERYWIKL